MPYPFNSAKELLDHSLEHGMAISTLMLENEKTLVPEDDVKQRVHAIWKAMEYGIVERHDPPDDPDFY